MSKFLTGDEILALDDLIRERLEIPEWGCHFWIRTMTGEERDAFEMSMVKTRPRRVGGRNIEESETDLRNVRAKLVSRVAVDESGEPMWTADKIHKLGKKSASALDRCFDVAKRLNHLTDDDVEELVKNSEGGQSGSSGSA